MNILSQWIRLKVLITVKTFPMPSKKYDELVCTAGVTKTGEFIRLFPVNFRDLPYSQQYKKYQWIEIKAQKNRSDGRKESYRPDSETLETGSEISTDNNWSDRSKYVLRKKSNSIEHLNEQREDDKTSLGIFKPKQIDKLVISPDVPYWNDDDLKALRQCRLFEDRNKSRDPPRKMPFKLGLIYNPTLTPIKFKNSFPSSFCYISGLS